MKTNLKCTFFAAAFVAALSIMPQSAQAQIFVTNLNGGVSEYNLDGTGGTTIVSGGGPYGITISGSTLYVGSPGEVSTYNFDGSGGSVFASGLGGLVSGIAVSGGIVYVSDRSNGVIDEYNATTKALLGSFSAASAAGVIVDGSHLLVSSLSGTLTSYNLVAGLGTTVGATTLASGLSTPTGIALSASGSDVYIDGFGNNSLYDYNFSSNSTSELVIGNPPFTGPGGVAVAGGNIYVTNYSNSDVDEFNAAGAPVGTNPLIDTGLAQPFGIAVNVPVEAPEPSTYALIGLGALALLLVSRRRTTNLENKITNQIKTSKTLAVITAALLLCAGASAQAQVFVTNFVNGTVSDYNLDGSTINTSLVSGLSEAYGITTSGSTLYVGSDGTIDTYNFDGTGAHTLVSGIGGGSDRISGLAVSGGVVYASDRTASTVNEYNATTGALIRSFSGAGTNAAGDVIVDGSHLIVSSIGAGTVTEYNLDGTGATTLVSGLSTPTGLTLTTSGSDLLIGIFGGNEVDDYNFTTLSLTTPITVAAGGPGGVGVSGSEVYTAGFESNTIYENNISGTAIGTITDGVDHPFDLTVVTPVEAPEPSTYALVGLGALALLFVSRRRKA